MAAKKSTKVGEYLRSFSKRAETFIDDIESDADNPFLHLVEDFPEELRGKALFAFYGAFRHAMTWEGKHHLPEEDIDTLFRYHFLRYMDEFPGGVHKQKILKLFGYANSIENNNKIDKEFIKTALFYFFEFYRRNKVSDIDLGLYEFIADIIKNDKRLVEFSESISQGCSICFTFTMRPFMSLDATLNELEDFKNNVEFASRLLNYSVRGLNHLTPFLGYITDKSGRIENFDKVTSIWKRYLEVFDSVGPECNLENPNKILAIGLKISKKFNVYKTYDKSDLRKNVRKDYLEAKKLIENARLGTFPH